MINEFGIPGLQSPSVEQPYAEKLVKRTRGSLTQKQQLAVTRRVERALKKEKVKKQAKRYAKVQKGIQKLKGYKTGKEGRIKKPKQPKFSKAVMGLTKAFMPEGADEGFQYLKSSGGKVKSSDGRGRPRGSYKARYIEGYGIVKVPTHIYNRMVSEAKAKRRLAEAKRQALYQQQMEAEALSASQDPRYQQTSEDAWADSEDLEHESNVERIRQQQQLLQQQMATRGVEEQPRQFDEQSRQPGLVQRGVRGVVERAKLSLMGSERERFQREGKEFPQQLDSYGRPQIDPNLHRPREPKLSLLGGKSNLFSKRNIMNQKNELF